MRLVTLRQYAEELGISYEAVRKKVNKNELQTKFTYVNNRRTKVIVLPDEEDEQNDAFDHTQHVKQPDPMVTQQSYNQDKEGENSKLIELLAQAQNQNATLVENLKHYAQLAGQTKLLVDSEERTKKEFYQLYQENKQLYIEVEKLKIQLMERDKRIEELEKVLSEKNKKKFGWF